MRQYAEEELQGYASETRARSPKEKRTLPVNWKLDILNLSVVAEYIAKVILSDVLREALDDNLDSLLELAIRRFCWLGSGILKK